MKIGFRTFFFFCCLFIFSACISQEHEIDFLNNIISSASADTSKAKAFVELTEIIGYSNPDTVIPLCEKALAIIKRHSAFVNKAEKGSFLQTKANAFNNIGLILMNRGDISQALD